MKHLGTISGNGRLIVSEDINERAEYKIDIWEQSIYQKTVEGVLISEPSALIKALEIGFILQLSDGTRIDGVVLSVSGSEARIHINTVIPGF